MSNDIRKLIDDNWDEIKELIVKKTEAEQKPKTIWDLDTVNRIEEYYYITEDGEIETTYFDSFYDEKIRSLGNAFLTSEEAEFEAERRRVEAIIRKYSKPFEAEEENYCIVYYHDEKKINISYYAVVDYAIPYFESEEIAKKVINEIGEDRLKKYWFGVTE
jgi:hypothetical protein|nr:MAG TPA: hypothetical protein [Caudoviricetes sp.]